jgi:phosphatidylserine/phosphatidylglycerophosphate/cardiolipin synthase-like enzyme
MRLVTLLLLLLGPSCVLADEPIQVFFGPRAADDKEGVYLNLLRFIDSAKKSIHASCHEVDMISVAEALAAKKKAGIDVQVVVEADWWGNAKNRAAREVLEDAKIPVYPDTKKSGLLHNKFFVADGKRVWTGSTNITETCLLYNPNSSVWVESDKVAANYSAEFDEQRQGKFGKRGSGKSNTPFPLVDVDKATRVRTVFSPEDNPFPIVVELIDSAKQTIDLMAFVLSSEEIGEALVKAHKRGVKVRVLLDNLFSSEGAVASWKYVPFKELRKVGVPCKFDDEQAKLHHKFIVVDGEKVMVGSFNFSGNAATNNDENSLVIDSASVWKKYATEFERLWRLYSGDPGEVGKPEKGDDDGK